MPGLMRRHLLISSLLVLVTLGVFCRVLQAEFVAGGSVVGNQFFRQLQANEAYCWRAKTPARLY